MRRPLTRSVVRRVRHIPPRPPSAAPAAAAQAPVAAGPPFRPAAVVGPREMERTAAPRAASRLSRWQKEFEQLSAAEGRVTRAAELLGISRQLLYYKMKQYGLDRRDFKRALKGWLGLTVR